MVASLTSNNSDYAESADLQLAQILDEVDAANVNEENSECSSDSVPGIAALLTDEFILNEQNWHDALFQKDSIAFDNDTQLVDLSVLNRTDPFSDSEDDNENAEIIEIIEIDSDETDIGSDVNLCNLISSEDESQLNPGIKLNMNSSNEIESDADSLPDLQLLGSETVFQRIITKPDKMPDLAVCSKSTKKSKKRAITYEINSDSSRSMDSTDQDIENLVDNREIRDGFCLKQDIHRQLMAEKDDKEFEELKRYFFCMF